MAEDSGDKPQLARVAIPLTWPVRAAVLAAGVACLGAGGVATFLTHVEGGPVALIAAGVIFGLIGAAGVVPTRVKAGDYEAEFTQEQRIARVLVDAIESAPQEDKPKVAHVVEAVAQVAPQAGAPALRAYDYVRNMFPTLVHVVSRMPGISIRDEPARIGGFRFDASADIPPADGIRRELLIEIGAGSTYGRLLGKIGIAEGYARANAGTGICLLIVFHSFGSSAYEEVTRHPWITLAPIYDPADEVSLERAIASAMSGEALVYPGREEVDQRQDRASDTDLAPD